MADPPPNTHNPLGSVADSKNKMKINYTQQPWETPKKAVKTNPLKWINTSQPASNWRSATPLLY
ncbi:MAG: hypothetical protein GF334_13720 [Candidatus Altiarchaeales archaeon]|nr:hypothetical protein [Candidatus Altiarchaeales archaeon]